MISTYNNTPHYYSDNSRDYQLFTHIYDAIFNTIKTNTDSILNVPFSNNIDNNLLELLAYTLGFESKHNYSDSTLYALCASLKEIIRIKGTKRGIEFVINLLLRAQNIDEEVNINISQKEHTVDIYIPVVLKDTILIDDIMDYILPAGYIYTIYSRYVKSDTNVETKLKYNNNVSLKQYNTSKFDFNTSLNNNKNESTSTIVSDITNTQILTPKLN